MEQTTPQNMAAAAPAPSICPLCHQPILPGYYFCPNCGANLHTAPLPTGIGTQLGIYAFSIILPIICYIFITKWPGAKYAKSHDPKAKMIGEIAWALLLISTVLTGWLMIVWTQQAIQSSLNSINTSAYLQ